MTTGRTDRRAIAEAIDRIVTLEAGEPHHIRGVLPRLYRAARRREHRPLAAAAAEGLLDRVRPGDRVLIATGMVAPPYMPRGETDGPPGAVALARALAVALGARPILLSEAEARPLVQAAAGALAEDGGTQGHRGSRSPWVPGRAWLRGCEIIPFPSDPEEAPRAARDLLAEHRPRAVISVERVGPNRKGVTHNMTGEDVTATQAKVEHLFAQARGRGILTIGIGDRGNEIGLGALMAAVRRIDPQASRCRCPCRSSTACAVPADLAVVAFTSNWGAYGVVANLACRLEARDLLHRPAVEARILRRCVAAGAVDGVTRRRAATVDGGSLALQGAILTLLRAVA